jgi:hypothetical protein
MRKLPVVLLCRGFPFLRKIRNGGHMRDSPPRDEGRYGQSSRNVRRVAMDAIGAQRRSARDAFDEAVWSRHPDAGVKLARATVTTEPGTPRRARNKSSNIARGMPDVFGCTCGLLVCFLFAHFPHTRLRVQRHPAFPAPSHLRDGALAEPGQIMPRECGCSSLRAKRLVRRSLGEGGSNPDCFRGSDVDGFGAHAPRNGGDGRLFDS